MKTYTYSEARQRLASLLDQAVREGRVQIRRQDGSTFVLQPVVPTRSPLDVPGVRSSLGRGELVALVRGERAASGNRMVEALATGSRHSVTAVVDELMGALDGPPDLSTNRKHMAGYGA